MSKNAQRYDSRDWAAEKAAQEEIKNWREDIQCPLPTEGELIALAREKREYDEKINSFFARVIGRKMFGFSLSVAMAVAEGHVRVSSNAYEPCCVGFRDARPLEEIFLDVRAFRRRKAAYVRAMRPWYAQEKNVRGNTSASAFAKQTTRPDLAPTVWALWQACADRPSTCGSCYNLLSPNQAEQIVMAAPMGLRHACGLMSAVVKAVGADRAASVLSRPGKPGSLRYALKAWRHCPDLPLSVARRIGAMPKPWLRVAAGLAWKKSCERIAGNANLRANSYWATQAPDGLSAKRKEVFWAEFRVAVERGRTACLIEAGALRSAAAITYRSADWTEAKAIASAVLASFPMNEEVDREEDRLRRRQEATRLLLTGAVPLGAWRAAQTAMGGLVAEWDLVGLTIRLVSCFGRQYGRWLKFLRERELDVHDWCQFLPLGGGKELGEYLLRYSRDFTYSTASAVCRCWSVSTVEERQLGPAKLIAAVEAELRERQNAWMKSVAQKQLLREAIRWNYEVSSEATYRRLEDRWAQGLRHAPIVDPVLRWTASGLVGRFLPRNDPRGLFLGHHTGCCQHPTGAGASCAWYGQTSARSGFFVVEDPVGEKILAQAWVWVGGNGGLVLDSIEGFSSYRSSDGSPIAEIFSAMGADMARIFGAVECGPAHNLALGLSEVPAEWRQTSFPPDYSGYSDAHGTRLLLGWDHVPTEWKAPKAFAYSVEPVREAAAPFVVRGGLEPDLADCERIAHRVYPEGW